MARWLSCDNCGAEYAEGPRWLCERCFELLRVRYEKDTGRLNRQEVANRARNLWRYRERLPADSSGDSEVGWTKLVEARRLGKELGVERLYVKDEGTGSPTGCVEDRGAAVAVAKSREFGFESVAYATLGAGARPVAAACARADMRCYIFAPPGGEPEPLCAAREMGAKVILLDGKETAAELFCREAGEEYGWGFLNLHLKPYWAEGLKTMVFEVSEQLGWELPARLVTYVGSGVLVEESAEAARELAGGGTVEGTQMGIHGVQMKSCAPIARAFSDGEADVKPWERPSTAAPSDPAWGKAAVDAIRESKGSCETATKEEGEKGRALLAETEGLLRGVRTGAAVWATGKLAREGKLSAGGITVIAATDRAEERGRSSRRSFTRIRPRLKDFDRLMRNGFR